MGLNSLKYIIKHKLLSVKPNGQYNFLTKKIHKKMDVDLVTSILNTDYFKENLVPQKIDFKHWKKVVVFAPHQDDEAIGCGALLHALSQKGCEIDLVFLTDGRPISKDADEVVNIRLSESQKVAEQLNANLININIDNVKLDVNSSQFKQLVDIMSNNYDAIFTTWLLDSPPKHRLCNALLFQVFKKAKLPLNTQIYTYQVHTALIPNVYFDYTEDFTKKQNLINYYQSQMKSKNYAHLSAGLDAWNSRFLDWSPEERYVEVYHQIPLKAFNELIKYYKNDPEQTFKSNAHCIKSYEKIMAGF